MRSIASPPLCSRSSATALDGRNLCLALADPRVAEFQALHPKVDVAVFTTTRAVDLMQEDIDCAIRHGRGSGKDLTATLLFEELMPIAAPRSSPAFVPGARTAWASIPLIRAGLRVDWTPRQKAHRGPAEGTVECRSEA